MTTSPTGVGFALSPGPRFANILLRERRLIRVGLNSQTFSAFRLFRELQRKGPIMADFLSAPRGEVDLASADAFRDRLYEIIDGCDEPIVRVDLQAVTFMDSQGYHALVAANDYAIRRGHIMTIRNLGAQVALVIGLCDWYDELHIEGRLARTPN